MKNYTQALGSIIIVALGILAVSTIKGTILWLTFGYIHLLFPQALPLGILPAELSWWESVCIAWFFASIIPAKASTSDKKDKKED